IEITPADADRLRDAVAETVDEADDLLQPRAGGGDEADAPAAHHVGEAERHAVEDGGAAVRPHEQPALAEGQALELELVGERHVVAEEEDVQAALERLERFRGG